MLTIVKERKDYSMKQFKQSVIMMGIDWSKEAKKEFMKANDSIIKNNKIEDVDATFRGNYEEIIN